MDHGWWRARGRSSRSPLRACRPLRDGQTNDDRAWERVDVPLEPQTAGDHTLLVAAGEDLLVVADAGDGGHVWVGERVSS